MDSSSSAQPPPLLPRRATSGFVVSATVAPPLPHRRAASAAPSPPAAAPVPACAVAAATNATATITTAAISIDAIRPRGCSNDYVDSNGLPIAPSLPPKPAGLVHGFKKAGHLGERGNTPPAAQTSTATTTLAGSPVMPLLADACATLADDARKHNLLNECRESDRLQRLAAAAARRSNDPSAAAALLLARSHATVDAKNILVRCGRSASSARDDVASLVELCPLASGAGSPDHTAAAAVVIVSQPLAAMATSGRKSAAATTALHPSSQLKASSPTPPSTLATTAVALERGGASGAVTNTIVCPRCGKCRCRACTEVRRLPETTLPCCGGAGECRCSADACVESASCMCCVRGLFYHCVDGGGGEDFSAAAEDPCACCERPLCCARWTALSMLAVTCLPCLCCYWPMRGCVAAATACYNCGRRKGCRCGGVAVEAGSTGLPRRVAGAGTTTTTPWRQTWPSGGGAGV